MKRGTSMEWVIYALAFFFIVSMLNKIAEEVRKNNKPKYKPRYQPAAKKEASQPNLTDYNQQLAIVTRGSYQRTPLVNNVEKRVYWALVKYLNQKAKGKYSVFAQVNLGEILKANGDDYKVINSKRIDLCITDLKNYHAICAVEVDGKGHTNDTSGQREAVKKIALEKAGIKYITINPYVNDQQLKDKGTGLARHHK